MKKVTTKVLVLMLIIPMLLIFTMATTIDMTAVMVDTIPVTSVDIEGEEVLFVDITGDDNFVKLNSVVSPKEATNKKVEYTTQSVGNQKQAVVTISSDGTVYPKSSGSIKVIATADGGRQDSVQINFYSTVASEVEQITENININVGEKTKIVTGTDFKLYPSSASGSITYVASNNKVKVDKYTGEITGLFTGMTTVTASIEGVEFNSLTNKFEDKTYNLDFNVIVSSKSSQEIFSFAGGTTEINEVLSLKSKVVPFSYIGQEDLGELTYSFDSKDEQYVKSVSIDYFAENDEGAITVILSDEAPEKDYIFIIKAGGVELGKVTIKKQLPTIAISASRTTYAKSNASINFGSVVTGLDSGYYVSYESTNTNIFSVNNKDNDCVGKAKNEGTVYVTATLWLDNQVIAVSDSVLFTIVNPYIAMAIKEGSETYGLENRFVLGKYELINGVETSKQFNLTVVASSADGVASKIDNSKLKWTSSDETIATVDETGAILVLKDGTVTIVVESAYNDVLQTSLQSEFEILCREKGFNIYDYEDLMFANQNNYETVLMNNIMLADAISDTNYKTYLENVATKQMNPTADVSYYKDLGYEDDAKIRYCVEFTSNVYGNGYYIDGNNITRAIDKYNFSVFKGPLDLVALRYGNHSSGNAKVKSQDNIVFLVKKDNISLNNVELKGCSDASLIESSQINLSKLDNVGTVLEIVGDNVNLLYSRVNNGRTVVRVYGTAYERDALKISENPNDYKIETLISNCILSYGREFILKVGSNQILKNESVYGENLELPSTNPSKYEHAAPSFTNDSGKAYSLTSEKDEYFINNYLMTDIILKDTIFYGAGLFCVGFDSQFAGLALHGYDYDAFKFSELGWKQVAGTSYPARIKMQGDVRFYDWKEVNNIDSSTIIEGDPSLLETIGLDLNVSNLLNKFNEEHPGNKVVYKYEGNDYINGAIVFYGGGKNYSWVDTSETNSNFNKLDSFEVPLEYFGDRVNLIYFAAGKENFKFMTYSSEGNLTYVTQKNDLADGSAYSWIIRSK